MLGTGKPVAAVCGAPGVLRNAKTLSGEPVVAGKSVTGFINGAEEAAGLSAVVPFFMEDMLRTNKGTYSKAAGWQPHVVADGLLIAGQNPRYPIWPLVHA